jgi:hypothetical protein
VNAYVLDFLAARVARIQLEIFRWYALQQALYSLAQGRNNVRTYSDLASLSHHYTPCSKVQRGSELFCRLHYYRVGQQPSVLLVCLWCSSMAALLVPHPRVLSSCLIKGRPLRKSASDRQKTLGVID